MLTGAGLIATFAVLDLAVTWPNFAALITLSGEYATTAGEAQRMTLVAAATYPSSVVASILLPVYAVLVPSLGILAIGLVMLKGNVRRSMAYVGVITGILGVVSVVGPFLVPALGLVVIPTSIMTTVWVVMAGFWLLRPGQSTVVR